MEKSGVNIQEEINKIMENEAQKLLENSEEKNVLLGLMRKGKLDEMSVNEIKKEINKE